MGDLVLSERRGRVLLVTISRPKALNALSLDVLRALGEVLADIGDARAVVLTGAGEKAFVAGADIAAMAERDLIDPQQFAERFQSAVQRWWHDSRADDLPEIVRNFHQVQSDELFVWPSRVELPPWVEDD